MEQSDTSHNGAMVASGTSKRTPILVNMADVVPKSIDWLWYPYLAYGQLAFLDGDPGGGKSLLCLELASRLSRGGGLPLQNGMYSPVGGEKRTTLLLSAEDALNHTVSPRLTAMGADLSYVTVLKGELGFDGKAYNFTLEHIEMLAQAIEQIKPALVVVDPIQAYMGKGNMNSASQAHERIEKLAALAEFYQCAVLCVRHLNKSGEALKAMYRGSGSIALIGTARLGLFIETHPTYPKTTRLFAQTKSNIGPHGLTQFFSVLDGHFAWLGPSRIDSESIAGGMRGPEPMVFLAAVLWLEEYMLEMDSQAWDIETLLVAGAEQGFTKIMIYKAKKALGIVSTKVGDGTNKVAWTLPTL